MFVCRSCYKKTLACAVRIPVPANARAVVCPWSTGLLSKRRSYATPSNTRAPSGATLAPSATKEDLRELDQSKKLEKLEWAVRKQLEWLKDPFHIAKYVEKVLDKGNLDEALLLTRKASKNQQVTVSWNHIIDHLFKAQKLHAAIKIYNEMKKRAQLPNAQTYTIIFRGCAQSQHPTTAVAEAVKIYMLLLSSQRLKSNTIHLNAVLDCCARANDLDSLFTVLNTVQEKDRSVVPNNWTYTIILNALREQTKPVTSGEPESLSDESVEKLKQQAIQRGKAIWSEVIQKWNKGALFVDEPLVCAMGRLLVEGNSQDNHDVFALLEQTMKLPRYDLSPTLNIKELAMKRAKESVSDKKSSEPTIETGPEAVDETSVAETSVAEDVQDGAEAEKCEEEGDREREISVQKQISLFLPPGGNVSLLPKASHKTLSLILQALTNLSKSSAGPPYWKVVTTVHNAEPDLNNYIMYLRLLRNGRASARAAEFIARMPREFVNAKTVRLAMSACVADNINPSAPAHARMIQRVHSLHMQYPDALALRIFLQAATGSYRHFQDAAKRPDKSGESAARLAYGQQQVDALEMMWEPMRVLCGAFSYPSTPTQSPEALWDKTRAGRFEVLKTARRMVAVMDRITSENMIRPAEHKIMLARKNILNRFIFRAYDTAMEMDSKVVAKRRGEKKILDHEIRDRPRQSVPEDELAFRAKQAFRSG